MEKQKSMPLIGDKFPDMEVETTHGKIKLPNDYKGKWLVLFSHPGDFTPVCTTEFVAFQKKYDEFRELDTELIGLSIDQVHSHLKWAEWIEENMDTEIEFPIIADPVGFVAKELGLIHSKATMTVRAVFIVDPDSTIRAILYYPAELGRNISEILRMIKGFQKSSKEEVAIPANWPENEIEGDKVIIPPASDVETIKKRRQQEADGEIECYDWWLCFKK
ncbi:AhpC/TSA family peroxiredoxin [Methanonatronarchaeum thermophilum]|uniref:Peroxiredoxin n=1 Tax=Methanonatronarchaeum thermophilum TaxID=1927129 RepID=A0A1Y3GAZ0_9EURY|nr:peroxiredoxin [Methanonatronarchaeum thermophilum]OUJ18621.1 AhpC/TSA family peroxiredoxin [Methanonatronarchaeum thermophilum]